MTPECVSGDVLISSPLNSFLSFNACLTHSSESHFHYPLSLNQAALMCFWVLPQDVGWACVSTSPCLPRADPVLSACLGLFLPLAPSLLELQEEYHRLSPGSEDDDTAFTHFSDLPVQSSSPVPDLRDPRWARILSPRGGHGPTPLDSVPWALDTGTSELLASLGRHGWGAEWPWTCPQSGAA